MWNPNLNSSSTSSTNLFDDQKCYNTWPASMVVSLVDLSRRNISPKLKQFKYQTRSFILHDLYVRGDNTSCRQTVPEHQYILHLFLITSWLRHRGTSIFRGPNTNPLLSLARCGIFFELTLSRFLLQQRRKNETKWDVILRRLITG